MGLLKEKVSLSGNKECAGCIHLPAVRAYCPSVSEHEIAVPEGRQQLCLRGGSSLAFLAAQGCAGCLVMSLISQKHSV